MTKAIFSGVDPRLTDDMKHFAVERRRAFFVPR